MTALVFSDSHGYTDHIVKAIAQESKTDVILFCGDIARDADFIRDHYPHIPLYAVRGNNDYFCDDPYLLLPVLEGVKIYLTHGHRERVKFGYYALALACEEKECHLCLFGHTHTRDMIEHNGITFVNPGSIGYSQASYARLNLKDGAFSVEFKTV